MFMFRFKKVCGSESNGKLKKKNNCLMVMFRFKKCVQQLVREWEIEKNN